MTLSVSPCRPAIEESLERARAGMRLSAQDAYGFAQINSRELFALLQVADGLRARHHDDIITYSRKVFLPLTTLCRDYCGYCTFRKDPGDPGARTMTPDDVLEVIESGEKLGCKEALFSLGDKPEALFPEMRADLQRLGHRRTLEYLAAMCRLCSTTRRCCPTPTPGSWVARISNVCATSMPVWALCWRAPAAACSHRAWRMTMRRTKIRPCG